MSKTMHYLDRSLNAIPMPIPICCTESEENREKEKGSERMGGKRGLSTPRHYNKSHTFPAFGTCGHLTLMEQEHSARELTSHHRRPWKRARPFLPSERKHFVLPTVWNGHWC